MKRCRKVEHDEMARSCKGEDAQTEETAIDGNDSDTCYLLCTMFVVAERKNQGLTVIEQ